MKFYKKNGELVTIPISQTKANLWLSPSHPHRQMSQADAIMYATKAGLTRTKPKQQAEWPLAK